MKDTRRVNNKIKKRDQSTDVNDTLKSELIRKQLLKQLYKKSYFEFFKAAVKVLEPATIWDFNWHHEYLCDLLQKEAKRINRNERKTYDYNINIPPRTGKSLIVSVCFNAWVWACVSPHHIFVCVSHTDELATELASKTKILIESDWYQDLFSDVVQLRSDSQAKSNFKTTAEGQRISFSMGSGVTGFGGHYIIIDDASKPNQSSPAFLEQTIKNWRETIQNRVNNHLVAVRIIIGQRIAEGDLSGYILSKQDDKKKKWKNIVLPIELTNDIQPPELAEKYINGCFWNSRFPQDSFYELTDSQYVFATQYLQRPAPLEGGIIKKVWFDTVDVVPNDITYHFFIDTAETTNKKKNDASTILVAGMKDNIIYIKAVLEYYVEFVELKRMIIQAVERYGNPHLSKVYIEPKSNGRAIVAALKDETTLNVIELPAPVDSKMTRIIAITPKLESKRVKLLQGEWNENFIYQISMFPNAKQDGIVDVLAYAVNKLLIQQSSSLTWHFV